MGRSRERGTGSVYLARSGWSILMATFRSCRRSRASQTVAIPRPAGLTSRSARVPCYGVLLRERLAKILAETALGQSIILTNQPHHRVLAAGNSRAERIDHRGMVDLVPRPRCGFAPRLGAIRLPRIR